MEEIRIPVTIGGVEFKNPFFVASGPTTKNVRQLQRIEETGWAAASIKLSIDPAPYINRKPRYALFPGNKALAFTAEKRLTFEQGLKLIRDAKAVLHDLKLFANITYAGDLGVEGWVNMAKKFEEAGADVIELNMCCPNMSYNVSLSSGGTQKAAKQTGASLGSQPDAVAEIVRAIKKEIHIPLFVKLTPEGGQIAFVAKAAFEAGADAVGGTANRLGIPDMDIDHPTQAIYHLQDEISMSCYCGEWLRPLAQRDTYEIRKVNGNDKKITAAGGIKTWKDAVEMILCGGDLLGVCAETLISGYDIVRPMIRGVKDYMDKHGFKSMDDFRNLIVPALKTAPELTIYDGYAHIINPKLSGPCKAACPLHVPVQAYVHKIAEGDFKGAYDLIMSGGALQGACSYLCSHPCEEACVRGEGGDPVRIRELKKYVLNKFRYDIPVADIRKNGKQAVISGTGPRGLSCAMELSKAGYDVTLLYTGNEPGGSLREAVDLGQMPQDVLEKLLSTLKAQGAEFVSEKDFTGDWNQVINAYPTHSLVDAFDEDHALEPAAYKSYDGKKVVIASSFLSDLQVALVLSGFGAKVSVVSEKAQPQTTFARELTAQAKDKGIKLYFGYKHLTKDSFVLTDAEDDGDVLKLKYDENCFFVSAGEAPLGSVASAVLAGIRLAHDVDDSIALPEAVNPVKKENVLKRNGYIGDKAKAVKDITTDEEAVAEASRCLQCGCGEGCQLCKTICTDFAPLVAGTDKIAIDKDVCVACGMCFNRCPNKNIEMINLGEKV